jgi:hypothetical protein
MAEKMKSSLGDGIIAHLQSGVKTASPKDFPKSIRAEPVVLFGYGAGLREGVRSAKRKYGSTEDYEEF